MEFCRPRQGLSELANIYPEDTTRLSLSCMFCCTEKRLQSFYQISAGDHLKQAGENLSFNIGGKLIRFYDHHMIVKEVQEVNDDGNSAIVTLIEFMDTPFDTTPKVRENTVRKHLYYDEIYVITYRHETHSPEKIIQRGQKLVKKDLSYNLLFRNCEHVARWCVCGKDTSIQAEGFLEEMSWFFRYLNKYVLRIGVLSVDDLFVAEKITFGPIVLLAIILHQLLKSRADTKVLNKLLKSRDICECCCKRRKRDIWLKFAALLTLQTCGLVATSLISTVSMQVLFGVLMSILTLQVMKLVPKFMKNINSPFVGRKVCVKSFKQIWIGDVISWKTLGVYHDGIVTGVTILPRSPGRKADVRVIHYTTPGIFAKGKIVEETIQIHLDRDELRLHDYTGYEFNEPEVVIERARKRLGETKFGLTNRSAHFCHWAKLKDTKEYEIDTDDVQHSTLTFVREVEIDSGDCKLHPLIINHQRKRPVLSLPVGQFGRMTRPSASREITQERVMIREDIEAGQLIQFRYRYLPHRAVCTAIRPGDKPSVVVLDVVHYGESKQVSEETFIFDLNKEDIAIVKAHPLYKFNKTDVIRRAKSRVGQRGYNLIYHRSSHLADEIVYKDKDQRIFSFSEVKPGDCIEYKYWGLPHQAVVVGLYPDQAKGYNIGHLTLVHYALDSLFGTRYIKREKVFFDLSEASVLVKAFPGCVLYPDELVVTRALSRLGERKFHISGNISSDVVHWAKVVQTPCVVAVSITDVDGASLEKTGKERKQYLLLPNVGQPYETTFRKDWVKSFLELTPGMIVRKGSVIGIVSKADFKKNELKMIQNVTIDNEADSHIGKVKEVTIKVDLLTEYIYIYRCDPRFSNKPQECVRKAKQLLGTKVPGMGEWGFCKDCVLKHH